MMEVDSSRQQEFNQFSKQQKIQKGLDYTRALVFDSISTEDQDFVFPDDLQSFTLQNLEVSPFPTKSRKVMKFIPTDSIQKFLDKNNFIQVNDFSVVFVNIDDLSYHNFENILNLDHLFDHVDFKLKTQSCINKKVQIFDIEGTTDTLLSLDKLNYYTTPLNATQRGGKRLIFHSNQLAHQLTKMINESDFFDKKKFRFINNVFRLNNFAPGDKKFKSHYDTPYADKSNNLYSKYTMLIYLTGSNKSENQQPPLKIEDIVFDEIKENSCIIFDQQLQHEGNAYFGKNKIFIRTELIYKMDGLGYDEKVAQMFNMACYMTKEIDQEQYSADLFNRCVKMRYNIKDETEEEIKKVYLLKRNLGILYATDGNYYWFPLNIPIEYIGTLVVLDYFNGKVYGVKNTEIQSKPINNIDYKKSEEEIDKFLFDLINSCSFENEKHPHDKADQFQTFSDFVPKNLCEEFEYFRCCCGLGDNESSKEVFKQQKEITLGKLEEIFNKNSVIIFDNKIKINVDNIQIETDTDENDYIKGSIIFNDTNLNVQNQINFASCNCEFEMYDVDVALFKIKKMNTFNLPSIHFVQTQLGVKLSIDIFKNGFIHHSVKTFKQPYTNEAQSFDLHNKRRKERNNKYYYYKRQIYEQNSYNSLEYDSEQEYVIFRDCEEEKNTKANNQNNQEINNLKSVNVEDQSEESSEEEDLEIEAELSSNNGNKKDIESEDELSSDEEEYDEDDESSQKQYPSKQKSKNDESTQNNNIKKIIKKD